jgi:hypothetical protein
VVLEQLKRDAPEKGYGKARDELLEHDANVERMHREDIGRFSCHLSGMCWGD